MGLSQHLTLLTTRRLDGPRPAACGVRGLSGCTAWLLLGLALGLPLLACAQINMGTSFNPVGSGARAMGEGNAFIAVADDATAASWNPAGLSQLERPEFSVAVDYWNHRGEIDSSSHPESQSSSDPCGSDLNYWSVAYPFDLLDRNMVFSLNYLKLFEMGQELQFPVNYSSGGMDNNNQYSLSQQGSLSVLAPALAVNVTDQLALGLTCNIWNDEITHSSSYQNYQRNVWTITLPPLMQQGIDASLDEFTVTRGYSLVAGALYRVDKCWTLGAVVKPPYTLDLRHTVVTDSQQDGDFGTTPPTRTTDTYDDELHMPLQIGTGVAMRPSDPLTLSLDVTWTQWSTFTMRQADHTYNPLNWSYPDARCQDTFTVRSGAEYILPWGQYQVPLRCGLGYDPGPAVEQVDDYYTASAGVGLQWSRYAIDAAYELRWGHKVNNAMLTNLGAQDVLQQRAMLSLIVYL